MTRFFCFGLKPDGIGNETKNDTISANQPASTSGKTDQISLIFKDS
jgi:hypothetical protein